VSTANGGEWQERVEGVARHMHALAEIVGKLTGYPMPRPPLDPNARPEALLDYQDYYAEVHRWLKTLAQGKTLPGDAQWGRSKVTP
jgi:hypothetical protein